MTRKKVSIKQAGKRLDVFVHQMFSGLSRAYIQKLIEEKRVLVNGESIKTGYKVRPGDKVVAQFNADELKHIPVITLPILYEDDDCMVIDKPVGVLTHSKGAFNPEATVATFIKDKLVGLGGERGGIVHRLDRATSGVIICAKNPSALVWLQKQFSTRKVKKIYEAVIAGHLSPPHAIIDMPIERHPKKPQIFRTGSRGKSAVTEYQVVAVGPHHDLVELRPQTGRTHQLRVHLKQLNHPIVGDTLYGGEAAERLFLHAKTLEITLPNRQRKVFNSPPPASFRGMVAA